MGSQTFALLFLLTVALLLLAYEDAKSLRPTPGWILLLWMAGLVISLTYQPYAWIGAVVVVTAWPFFRGWWGYLFLLYPPLIPLVMTAALVRQGRMGVTDLWLFSLLHFFLPWWGPWVVALGWHLYTLHQRRRGYSLIPAVPGLLVGWAVAMVGMLAVAHLMP